MGYHVTEKMVASKGGKKRKVYVARWKNEAGRTREKSFERKKDARAHAVKMADQVKATRLSNWGGAGGPKVSFRWVCVQYLRRLRDGTPTEDPRAPITVREYASLLQHHVLPVVDYPTRASADSIDKDELDGLISVMGRNGASFDRIERAVKVTKAVLKFAHAEGYRESPAPAYSLKKPASVKRAKQKKADQVYSPNQIYTLLRAADDLAHDQLPVTRNAWATYRPMIYFYVHTGARNSEGRAIRVSDFNFNSGVIEIRQTADEKGNIHHTKSLAGWRDIPLSDDLAAIMEPYLKTAKHELAFATRNGTARAINNLHRFMLKPVLARANELASRSEGKDQRLTPVQNFGIHGMRHAFASRLISRDFNLKQLQVWMGHHDPAFTLRVYGHLFKDDVTDFTQRMAV